MNKEHSEVVGEGSEDRFVGFEEDVSNSHSAVAQEAKFPLSVKLLQQDKTMVGQLHSSTCTKTHKHTQEAISFPSSSRREVVVTTKDQAVSDDLTTSQRLTQNSCKESLRDNGGYISTLYQTEVNSEEQKGFGQTKHLCLN